MITRFFLLFVLFLSLQAAPAVGQTSLTVTVARVVDGDTFLTEGGEYVRLLDINAPEIAHGEDPAEPLGETAKARLTSLIDGQAVTLEFGPARQDRYNRLLAHVYRQDGLWVNKALVTSGMAHVYTFPDNRLRPAPLLLSEKAAREAKKGLWALPQWRVFPDETAFPPEFFGRFVLVEGRVQHTARTSDKIYLNFGEDWKTDFTIEIPKEFWGLFTKNGLNIPHHYKGKTLLARGRLKPVNGALITVTHPEELTILDGN